MGTYVSNAQITAHLPYRTFTSSTSPSTTDVDAWIEEAEALLESTLNAAQITTPITTTAGIRILRAWLTNAVVGTVRLSFAASGGDPNNVAGQAQIDQFNERLTDILNKPQLYQQQLAAGSGTSAARQIRAYTTDNTDSKTISGGDFDPTFTTGTKF